MSVWLLLQGPSGPFLALWPRTMVLRQAKEQSVQGGTCRPVTSFQRHPECCLHCAGPSPEDAGDGEVAGVHGGGGPPRDRPRAWVHTPSPGTRPLHPLWTQQRPWKMSESPSVGTAGADVGGAADPAPLGGPLSGRMHCAACASEEKALLGSGSWFCHGVSISSLPAQGTPARLWTTASSSTPPRAGPGKRPLRLPERWWAMGGLRRCSHPVPIA